MKNEGTCIRIRSDVFNVDTCSQLPPEVIAAYVGIAITALVGLAAFFVSLRSLGIQQEAVEVAMVTAEAANRANWLAEQRLLAEVSGGQLGEAVKKDRPDVSWLLARRGKNTYVLRNVGSETATHVRIDPESISAIVRALPVDATIRPQESAEFMMVGALGAPVPNEIYVFSEGYEADPQVVAVPA